MCFAISRFAISIVAGLLLTAALSLTGCSDNANNPPPANSGATNDTGASTNTPGDQAAKVTDGTPAPSTDTPAAAFTRFRSAMKSKDYKTGYAQMTPESQDLMLGAMAATLNIIAALDQSKEPDVRKILEKYGVKKLDIATLGPTVDQKAVLKDLIVDVKDKPGCLMEAMTWMENNSPNKEQATGAGFANVADAELVDLKIDGDSASATVKTKSGDVEKSDPVKFKKVEGAWLIDISDMLPSGPPPAAK